MLLECARVCRRTCAPTHTHAHTHSHPHPLTHTNTPTHPHCSILIRLLRRNSMAALELHQRTPVKSRGHEVVGPLQEDGMGGAADERESLGMHDKDVVATRTGVLQGCWGSQGYGLGALW